MKKMISMLLTMMLFGGVLLLPAAAEADQAAIEAVAAGLTLDLLTSQSSYAVTKPLDLASDSVKSLLSARGAAISWSTEDSDVLTISGSTAAITRGHEDQTVSLTAQISKNNARTSKSLFFTVPSAGTFVFESEGFGYPDKTGQYVNSLGSRWGKSGNDEYFYSTIQNVSGNYVMEAYHPMQNDNAMTPTTCYSFEQMPQTSGVTVEFTLTMAEDAALASSTLYYDVKFGGNTTSNIHTSYINWLNIEKANNRSVLYNVGGSLLSSTLKRPAIGESMRLKYVYTFGESPVFTFYVDGEAKATDAALPTALTELTELHFNIQRFGKEGRFYVDDLVVTAAANDVTVEGLTAGDVGALKVEVAGTNSMVTVTSDYDDTSQLIQKIGDTTTDNRHFDHFGSWLADKKSGSQTMLLERMIEDETAPPMINGAYLGANHGPTGPVLTVANHGKTFADIGTYWQAGDGGGNWTLVKIVDANSLQFIGESWGSGAGAFIQDAVIRFNGGTAQTSGTLTSLDGTEEVISFTAQAANQQIFPSFANRDYHAYAVVNGQKQEVDLNTVQTLRCDRLILEESYDITDPTQIAERLRTNRPAGGYTTAPVIACGDTVLKYHETITVMEDGTVITELDHEVKKAINSLTYYGYQYYMKNNFGGGIKRYMPDTKAFTAAAAVYSSRDGFSAGASKAFDFSVPRQLISGSYFDYPAGITPDKSVLWANQNKAPSRVVDYLMRADGATEMAFANGFLPVGDGANANRLNYATSSFFFYGSMKAYPVLVNQGKTSVGSKIQAVVYRKHDNTARVSEAVQAYSVSYDDEIYYYIDILADCENVTLQLPAYFDTINASVVEVTGSPDYLITGNTVTLNGSQKEYVVLKAPRLAKSGAAINEVFYNMVNYQIQAEIANPGSSSLSGTAVAAGYDKKGALCVVESQPVTLSGSTAQILTFVSDFSQADTCKVFLFSDMDALQPLCGEGYTEVG